MMTDKEKEFILKYINEDVNKLALNKPKLFDDVIDFYFVLSQISARQKIKNKLPFLYNNFNILLPKTISLEQSSSEETAVFKSNIFDYQISCDISGGMGIDSIFFAKKAVKHYYIEKDAELCNIFEYNCKALGLNNVEIVNAAAESFIKNNSIKFDLIYADPSRRGNKGEKTYYLEDTQPNIIDLIEAIKLCANNLMIKCSPMLDFHRAVKQIPFISNIYSISIANECKELLMTADFENDNPRSYQAVMLNKNIQIESFCAESFNHIEFSKPQKYLYEPDASIMKLGFWNEIAVKYNVYPIASNSRLYTSGDLKMDFPGRIFQIDFIEKFDKKNILKHLPDKKANIAVRNFYMKPEEIKKRFSIQDGGKIFIFVTRLYDDSASVLICSKIKH